MELQREGKVIHMEVEKQMFDEQSFDVSCQNKGDTEQTLIFRSCLEVSPGVL